MKINAKVERAFAKVEDDIFWICPLTSHDASRVKRLMQQMYDLGHADGYAEGILQESKADEKKSEHPLL